MATPFPFVSGAVLEASQLNSITELPVNAKTASYTLVAGDAGDRIQMTSASATTITVNTGLFSAGQSVSIYNNGAGSCTITPGTATVTTTGALSIPTGGGGTLLFTSHDHELVATVANRIIEIGPNGFIDKMMPYDDYLSDDKIAQLQEELYK